MISNYGVTIHGIQVVMISNYPWYSSSHDNQLSMVSKYPGIRKKWYPLIPNSCAPEIDKDIISQYLSPVQVPYTGGIIDLNFLS
jgi:hypothetical protein